MSRAAPLTDENEEKQLDPAVERVRRRLLRFVVINLSLLFTAVIIVIAAVVYRSATKDAPPVATDIAVPDGEMIDAQIPVPAGSRLVSQSLSGNRVSLDLETANGERIILVYDIGQRRVIARLALASQ
jgi:hypothetical protein